MKAVLQIRFVPRVPGSAGRLNPNQERMNRAFACGVAPSTALMFL